MNVEFGRARAGHGPGQAPSAKRKKPIEGWVLVRSYNGQVTADRNPPEAITPSSVVGNKLDAAVYGGVREHQNRCHERTNTQPSVSHGHYLLRSSLANSRHT